MPLVCHNVGACGDIGERAGIAADDIVVREGGASGRTGEQREHAWSGNARRLGNFADAAISPVTS
jgi:hypothetical protein